MQARAKRAWARRSVVAAVVATAATIALLVPGVARAQAPPTEARSLTVTPSTDLDDGQTVSVDGAGWRPGVLVFALECLAGTQTCGGAVVNQPVDTDGTFTMALAVRVVFTAFDGTPVDCRVDACEVTAVNEENEDHFASVPIAFDPATVLLPPPALSVTPDTDLVDGQTVSVAGTGFLPGVGMLLAQCRPGQSTMEGCLVYSGTPVEADASGAFEEDLRLSATFFHPDGTVDCRVEACELVAGLFFGGVQARAVLGFDPDAPLLPPRAVTVTPDTDLVDGQVVAVRGTNFRPGSRVIVLQCADTDTLVQDCSVASHPFEADGDGAFAGDVRVASTIDTIGGGTFDCVATPCVMRFLIVTEEQTIDVPLAFAPPPGPPPARPVAVTPRFTG